MVTLLCVLRISELAESVRNFLNSGFKISLFLNTVVLFRL